MTDWKKLKHARGPATQVPALAKELVSNDDDDAARALQALDEALYTEATWYPASAPAVELLAEVAASQKKKAHRALWLVADVISGSHVRALADGAVRAESKEAKETREVAVARKAQWLAALGAKEPTMRSAAAQVLAFLPEIANESLPALRKQLAGEKHPGVKASLVMALGVLGRARGAKGDKDAIAVVAKGGDALVRGAAALATLILDPDRSPRTVARDLAAFLGAQAEEETFVWGGFDPDVARGLLLFVVAKSLDDARQWGVCEALMDVVRSSAPADAARAATHGLLTLAGFKATWSYEDVALPEELDDKQRKIAEAIASRDDLGFVGFGLPGLARDARRWLGIAKATPLEQRIRFKVDGKTVEWPRWKIWIAERPKKAAKKASAPQALEGLSRAERLECLLEQAVNAYGIAAKTSSALDREAIEEAIDGAGADGLAVLERFVKDIPALLELEKETGDFFVSEDMIQAVVTKLLAAKKAIPPALAGKVPLERDVLEPLPYEVREARIWALLEEEDPDPESEGGIEEALELIDLAPSRRIADVLVAKLHNRAVRTAMGTAEAKAHLAKLGEIAKSAPEVAAAIAKFSKKK